MNFNFLFTEIALTTYERVVEMSEVNAVQKQDMPEINAQAAIVVTQHEGKILLEKNAKLKLRPAIATKILAAIIGKDEFFDPCKKISPKILLPPFIKYVSIFIK